MPQEVTALPFELVEDEPPVFDGGGGHTVIVQQSKNTSWGKLHFSFGLVICLTLMDAVANPRRAVCVWLEPARAVRSPVDTTITARLASYCHLPRQSHPRGMRLGLHLDSPATRYGRVKDALCSIVSINQLS